MRRRLLQSLTAINANGLPTGYKRVEYLESTGEQYIELPQYLRDNLGVQCEYLDFISEGDTPFLSCLRTSEKERYYAPYCSKQTAYYGWSDWKKIGDNINNKNVRTLSTLNYMNVRKWRMEFGGNKFEGELAGTLDSNTSCKIQIFRYFTTLGNSSGRYIKGRVFFANVSLGERIAAKLVPCLDRTGAPCMFDLVSRKPFYNQGTDDFIYPTESTTYSLRRVLPDWGKLTPHGLRRLYHAPANYKGELYDYALENGYKPIVEPEKPEEGYWTPRWTETDKEIVLEWKETEPPEEEFNFIPEIKNIEE